MSSDFIHGALALLGAEIAGVILLAAVLRETKRYLLGQFVEMLISRAWKKMKKK